jgi:hypothetical protein
MPSTALPHLAAAVLSLAAASSALAQTCHATAGAQTPTVVELYTSEGCSSCPPADKWLSTLKGRPDVLALSFHVNYWDRLGWPDRFASAEATQRQHELARLSGSSQVYTPQVVVGGQDWRRWPALPVQQASAPVTLQLRRAGDQVLVEVGPAVPGTPALAGYWAVLEDGHVSRVRAGENAGVTLQHDHVVRLLQPVPRWAAGAGLQAQLKVSSGDPATPRRVAFVVTDAASQRPVQALALNCQRL